MKKFGQYTLIGLSVVIGLIMFITILRKIQLMNVKQSFEQANIFVAIAFVLTSVTMMLLFTLRWYYIVNSKRKVPFKKLFLYKIVGYGISFITPAAKVGGEPLRAMLLQKHGFTFREGFSTITIDKLVDLTTTGFLFILGSLVALTSLALPGNAEMFLMVFMIIVIGIIIWFYFVIISDTNIILKIFKTFGLHKISKLKKVENNIIEMDKLIVTFYKNNKENFNKAMIVSSVVWLLMFLEYKLALMIVGITNIPFGALFLIIGVMGITYLIPIPLALGVLEAGQLSIFAILKLSRGAAIGLSAMIRARDFVWTLVAIGILLSQGMNFRKAYDKSVKEGGLKQRKPSKKVNVKKKTKSK